MRANSGVVWAEIAPLACEWVLGVALLPLSPIFSLCLYGRVWLPARAIAVLLPTVISQHFQIEVLQGLQGRLSYEKAAALVA